MDGKAYASLIQLVPVEEEFRRNPELKKSDLEILYEWYKKQPHLPRIPESTLILFLHSNYYRIEPTKKTLENFFTIRTHVPEIFANRDPLGVKQIRQIMKVVCTFPLPKATREGYKVIFGKLIDFDASKFVYADVLKYFCMVSDLWVTKEGTCPGIVLVCDTSNLTLGHVARINPMVVKKFMMYVQEATPVRLKGIHVANAHPVVDAALNIIKPFMKADLLDLLHLHTSKESLDKYVPIEVLPKELGGSAGPVMELHEKQIKDVESHRDWFMEFDRLSRVDESLRPGKAKNASDLFGVEGTFKKLDID